MNYNRVILGGNLTRDPEGRNTPNSYVTNFGLAVNRKRGEREEVLFVDIEAWGRTAETIERYFSKGKPILIEGRLKLETWEDNATGAKRSKIKVIAESFQFVGKSEGSSGGSRSSYEPPADSGGGGGDDDIPF